MLCQRRVRPGGGGGLWGLLSSGDIAVLNLLIMEKTVISGPVGEENSPRSAPPLSGREKC